MTAAATDASEPVVVQRPATVSWWKRIRIAAGNFWLGALFSAQRNAPWLLRIMRPFVVVAAWRLSKYMRESILENANYLLEPDVSREERHAFGRRVLVNFYEFIREMGNERRIGAEELDRNIRTISGEARYLETRAAHTGAILLTAHLGAFETAIAALRRREQRVHVVFQRDPLAGFERLRTAQRERLGVIEAPVDDGIANWMRLRDALTKDEVVLLQGDRVMSGQKGRAMPFLSGRLVMPTGPVKLALASGAPIVPVFSPRTPDGRIDLFLEEPIVVDPDDPNAIDEAMNEIAAVTERFVRMYPDQWLMIHPAWQTNEKPNSAVRP